MNKVVLIIIYNHRYDKNVAVIENIYKNRFSYIYHLVPFYNGNKENVIPVYENSFYFQGYISQGFKKYFREEFVHYLFMGDDLFLNPVINENNYQEYFKVTDNCSFLPEMINLHERNNESNYWDRVVEAFNYNISHVPGVETKEELPAYRIAVEAFKKHGLELKPLTFNQINLSHLIPTFPAWYDIKSGLKYWGWRVKQIKNRNRKYHLSYPLIGSYSDICIVSSNAIRNFCHYCGVFAATRLHVEVALPTALVLSEQVIITEKDLELQGFALWTAEDYKMLDKYDYQLSRLMNDFPANHLYLHPVKLSKWITDTH